MADNLHSLAVEAEANLEKLATGLAEAGADKPTLDVISKMAEVTRKLVKTLGAGQEQTADTEPPAPQPVEPPRETMDSATDSLVRDVRGG